MIVKLCLTLCQLSMAPKQSWATAKLTFLSLDNREIVSFPSGTLSCMVVEI